jgi:hypothetical protein
MNAPIATNTQLSVTLIYRLSQQGGYVAQRQIKMPVKDKRVPTKESSEEAPYQRKQPKVGRYLLQVDGQTKGSFNIFEAARSAAVQIKTGFPILQVSIYDSVSKSDTLVDLPARSSSQP